MFLHNGANGPESRDSFMFCRVCQVAPREVKLPSMTEGFLL